MDVIESIKKDKAYLKCKLIVKNWENEFKTKHSRTPSKFDIKEAPAKIKYAYKKYFQLKSAALECSFSMMDDDENCSPEQSSNFENICVMSSNGSPQSSDVDPIIPALPTGAELEKLLSKQDSKQKKISHDKSVDLFSENLSKKLFQNKKFSLRNPRKLSLNKSQSSQTQVSNEHLDSRNLPNDNSEIGIEEFNFCESSQSKVISEMVLKTHIDSMNNKELNQTTNHNTSNLRQINSAWLDRASDCSENQRNKIEPVKYFTSNQSFGITNIVLPNEIEKTIEKSDFVENSESEGEESISKLKPALKKRRSMISNDISEFNQRHSETENNQKSKKFDKIPKNKQSKPKFKEDVVKDNALHLNPPDITEYMPFGIENEVIVPRLKKIEDNILNTKQPPKNISAQKPDSEDLSSKLDQKIRSGTINDNYVKINIEKKVYVRGKKNIKYSTYKKKLWKDKKALHASMEHPEAGKISCFKCGETGHMARYCTAHKGDTLLPLENYSEAEIPTLADMQDIVTQESKSVSLSEDLVMVTYEPSQIPDSFMKLLMESPSEVKPIYENYSQATTKELLDSLRKFGHDSFRTGQEEAIMRILCGMSTLLILSTGSGKSLCYQLPAYIYSQHFKCITLVISPLVSLMEDQVLSMPEFLKAGCLHTNQSQTQRNKIIQYLKDGEINILLISPEALISGDGSNGFSGLFKSLPPIAFACIDEAHCVSQWSHNFRPSYLMICKVLKEKLNVKCILGLTATASQSTISGIINHIGIPDGVSGVIVNPTLPDNLCLSVSFEVDKDRALISLLSSDHICQFNSIIVYCIRRDECMRVAGVLRSCLQEPGKISMEKQNNKRKRMSFIAEAYHAGMSAAQRKKIQKYFMDGTLRIIVATVAFGMGINKSDIRCIVHYDMPSSFESYVQEVGRAGRDGKLAYCHVFMNKSNNDKNELLKHIYANTIDRPTIRKLLQKVFIPCECSSRIKSETQIRCKGHEVGIPIDETVEELDLPSENIATLLCYIELHPKQYIKVLNNAYMVCKISSYGGPHKILEAAKTCPPLAMAYLLESKKDLEVTKKSVFEFNIIEVAAAIGWESGITKYHLKNLEWINVDGFSKRSFLKVEFSTIGYRIKAAGDLSSIELDDILNDLHNIVILQEKSKLCQLEECYEAFNKIGNYSYLGNKNLSNEFLTVKSDQLKETIKTYFARESNITNDISIPQRPLDIERVVMDIKALISTYKDCTFTGRSIARIFQGISSPNYPALVWGRCKFWRSHIHEDFYGIMKLATQQIIQMKML